MFKESESIEINLEHNIQITSEEQINNEINEMHDTILSNDIQNNMHENVEHIANDVNVENEENVADRAAHNKTW
jgi:hypothetical protein